MNASNNIEDYEVGYNIPVAIGMDEMDIHPPLSTHIMEQN